MKNNPVVLEKKEQLIEMVTTFCELHLDEEYGDSCRHLVEKMARKKNVPFVSGRLEIWAAAVVYAIGQINYLFDSSAKPYIKHSAICDHFGTAVSTTGQKAALLRNMFKMHPFASEFSTSQMRQNNPLAGWKMINGYAIPPEIR